MKTKHKVVAAATLGIPAVFAAGILWLIGGWPEKGTSYPPVFTSGNPPEKQAELSEKITVFSYNMHFGVGRDDDHTKQSRESILKRLDQIAGIIKDQAADVVLLQEVDYDSDRSYNIDQLKHLAEKTGLHYMAPIVTWKKGYIPYPWPPSKMFGKMLSGQAVLSRFPISNNIAITQEKPQSNPFWYNAFYLQRTIQHVTVDINQKTLDFLNIHTEAFDLENRQKHAEQIRKYVQAMRMLRTPQSHNAIIMAGDFNAVPPEASLKNNFPDEPDNDMTDDQSVAEMRKLRFTELIDEEKYRADEKAAFTFPSDTPCRRLDYFYISPELKFVDGGVLHEAGTLSDHLPLVGEVMLELPAE